MGPKPTSGTVHRCACAPEARHRDSARKARAVLNIDLMSILRSDVAFLRVRIL